MVIWWNTYCIFLFTRMEINSDNTLILMNVLRSNEGNYSCHVRNSFGSDEIMYFLQVQGKSSVKQGWFSFDYLCLFVVTVLLKLLYYISYYKLWRPFILNLHVGKVSHVDLLRLSGFKHWNSGQTLRSCGYGPLSNQSHACLWKNVA